MGNVAVRDRAGSDVGAPGGPHEARASNQSPLRRTTAADPEIAIMEMLVFEIAAARYAIPLDTVREVVRAVAITRLPKAPAVVAGVINVRGTAVPVYDVRARFGAPARELDPGERFVIVRAGSRTAALWVDHVHWIREVGPADVQDVAELVGGAEYVTGVARLADGLLLIHDLDGFLTASEAGELERVMGAPSAGGAG